MIFNNNLKLVAGVSCALVTAFFLASCGDSSQQKAARTDQVVGGGTTPTDPLGPRYQATLSEGITFNREGYPDFVSTVKGIAFRDDGGRWTEGEQAIIEFSQLLPKNFTLKIKAAPFAPTVGKPVAILIGNAKVETTFTQAGITEVSIPVATDGKAKSVIFKFPDPKSPAELGQSTDPRRLSLYLITVRIE